MRHLLKSEREILLDIFFIPKTAKRKLIEKFCRHMTEISENCDLSQKELSFLPDVFSL